MRRKPLTKTRLALYILLLVACTLSALLLFICDFSLIWALASYLAHGVTWLTAIVLLLMGAAYLLFWAALIWLSTREWRS